MDPTMMTVSAVVTAVVGALARLAYRVVKERAEVRRAEVAQQGLSERVRSLPPGSRLSERSTDREVEILIGDFAGRGGER
ncbi:hypothetical protein OG373_40680 [Streptomyces avidinii]|uniref:hypothetical protein n=1 Tax=Streptomyces avidinii TaxID=1895 RepID=UPI00386753E6|nr:hypothetical protein OG373_00490 [Streptomyces avidinii]WTB02176.1 hypothetical protein OG373_40680 [Streptomyces avidinii]